MYKSIALVDLSCLFKRTFEANPNKGAENTLAEILRLEGRVEHIIICLDAPPYSRKDIYPDYKAHREEPTTTEVYQKRWLYEKLTERGYPMARHKGAEADDVIATLARIYGETTAEVWLVGADKDLAQCVTDNVLQLIPSHGERAEHFRGPKEVKEKYGVAPEQMPLWLALVGDKTDNVPGVKGIGQVKASGLIAEFKTLTGIAENLKTIGGAMGKALADGWQQLVLSLKLTTLDARLPLDAGALLTRRAPGVPVAAAPVGEVEFDGFEGNATPMPEPAKAGLTAEDIDRALDMRAVDSKAPEATTEVKPEPIIGKDPRADEFLRQEAEARAQRATERKADRAARERQEERQSEQPGFPRWPDPEFAPVQEPSRYSYEVHGGNYPGATGPIAGEQKMAEFGQGRTNDPPYRRPAAPAPVAGAEFDPIGKSPGASGPLPPVPAKPAAPVVTLRGPAKASLRGLALLRAPFEKHQISKLPKGTKEQNNCPPSEKRNCNVCGGWHHPRITHLDYVGHAALTDRLLEVDPLWSWEPMGLAPNGLPLFDASGGLWIRLTVCGVTRLGYGHAPAKPNAEPGAREKEIIGDALRNAAMRFGAALELWHKGDDLHGEDWDAASAWRDAMGGE